MFIPGVYPEALMLMVLSMVCWESWANTQKAAGSWRFELFYWDYVGGILLCASVVGLTFGRTDPSSPDSFFQNLSQASHANLSNLVWVGDLSPPPAQRSSFQRN